MHPGPSALIGNEEAMAFIRNHEKEDPYKISLNFREAGGLPVSLLARQIESRQKARTKLPSWCSKEGIIFPDPANLQQSSSEATAMYKKQIFGTGPLVDLTGGSGVDAFFMAAEEAVHFVEVNEELCRIARHNFNILGQPIIPHTQTAESFVSEIPEGARIFLDPSRRDKDRRKTVLLRDSSPDVTALLPLLLERSDRILLKASPMIDIQAAIEALDHHVSEVHVLEWAGECKEVLFRIVRDKAEDPEIHAVILDTDSDFVFHSSGEKKVSIEYGPMQDWLYEPSPAIMKAGLFKSLGTLFGLTKIDPNTHLYSSSEKKNAFPGRTFRVTAVRPYSIKTLKRLSPGGKANITVRNFPGTVAEVRKKSGIRDGGNTYIFLYTGAGNSRMICQCEKDS